MENQTPRLHAFTREHWAERILPGEDQSISKYGLLRDIAAQWRAERIEKMTLVDIFTDLRNHKRSLRTLLFPEKLHDATTQIEQKYISALDVAAALGTIPVNLDYHNHHHAREVTLICQELLATLHPFLPARYVYLTLITACIHDYGHNGKGNHVGSGYVPVLLERHAVESAWPHLEKAGLGIDDKVLIEAIVDATDVFAPPKHESPRAHLRDSFNPVSNFPAPHSRFATSRLLWEQDPHIRACASILSDADLSLSCGMPQDFVNFIVSCIEAESKGKFKVTDDVQRNFYTKVCAGFPLSPAGEKLFGQEYRRKLALC